MKAPTELTKDDRKLWDKLFTRLETDNPVVIEQAKRYLVWFNLFARESKAVEEGQTTAVYNKNNEGASPHVKNMKEAEVQMKRLWDKLEPYFEDAKKVEKSLGQFEGL